MLVVCAEGKNDDKYWALITKKIARFFIVIFETPTSVDMRRNLSYFVRPGINGLRVPTVPLKAIGVSKVLLDVFYVAKFKTNISLFTKFNQFCLNCNFKLTISNTWKDNVSYTKTKITSR